MKLGITGLSGSGKSTVFEALTRNISGSGDKRENRIGIIPVPDQRVDILSSMYNPRKTTYARVEYFLPGQNKEKKTDIQTPIRDCDALIHVIRNFGGYGYEEPAPYNDFLAFDQELVIADLVVVEKRLERLSLDKKRGKDIEQEELSLLKECLKNLENETPLRKCPDLALARHLKGYAFLSAKPMLLLFNNQDDDNELPVSFGKDFSENCMVIRGKLEHELAQMSDDETEDFLAEFNIEASATDRVIKRSYELLGLISFFTVGDDEVRAWTIKKGTQAADAAEVIHTDLKKGFIRAEVVSYDDLTDAGTYNEARKKGTVRLEGKTYDVKDGDIMQVRFNV